MQRNYRESIQMLWPLQNKLSPTSVRVQPTKEAHKICLFFSPNIISMSSDMDLGITKYRIKSAKYII